MTARMDLSDERVDLWIAGVPSTEATVPFERWLSAEERRTADAVIRPASRLQRLVAYAARRAVLSFYATRDQAAWCFVAGPHGRPELVSEPGAPQMRVSLSHSDAIVVIAVTQGDDVGVDIERIDPRRRVMDIAERCFAPEETAVLRAAPAEARPALFATIWTLKESYLKARGVGVWGGVDLQACRFECVDAGREPRFFPAADAETRPQEWRFFTFMPERGYRGAIAVRGSTEARPRLAAFRLLDRLDAFTPVALAGDEELFRDDEDAVRLSSEFAASRD